MKTFLFVLLLFVCNFILAQKEEKIKTGRPINSGFVFIDGQYIELPYNISIKNNTIYINNIQAYKTYKEKEKPKFPKIKEDPGLPPDTIKTWNDFINYKRFNSKYSFICEKIIYYYTKYPPEEAKNEMRKYLLNLPFVINGSATKGGYIEFQRANGEVYGFSWKKFAEAIINKKDNSTQDDIKKLRESILIDEKKRIIKKLNAGGTVLWSNTNEMLKLHNIGDSASTIIFFDELLKLKSKKNTTNDTICYELYKSGLISESLYRYRVFKEFINNFAFSENFTSRLNNLRNHFLAKYGNNWNEIIMKKKVITTPNNESPAVKSNSNNGSLNYSPDKNNFFYICPYVWDPAFTNYIDEINYVENEISLYGYPNTSIFVDNDDDDIAIPVNTWKNLSAGVLFISAHGEELEFQGMVIADFISEYIADTYIATEANLHKHQYFDDTGLLRYSVYADNNFFNTYTFNRLTNEKTIVLLGVCDGLDVSNLIGGGAVFGYKNPTNYYANKSDFTRLLSHMNGTQEGGTVRSASDAYDNIVNWHGLKLEPAEANITLCPATNSFYPTDGITVPLSGDGYFETDTWCTTSIPANQALTFNSGSVQITNVNWEDPESDGMSNKITYHWSGVGQVTVNVNSSAFHSWGAGGDANGYNILDFDRKTPNGENESYTFYTSNNVDFSASFTNIVSGSTVNFQITQNNITNYTVEWIFEGGSISSSTSLSPNVTYNNVGDFDVTLIVTDVAGNQVTVFKNNYIHVSDGSTNGLLAKFSVNPTSGNTATYFYFSDESLGAPTQWTWNIFPESGFYYVNGTNNHSQNPVVRFNSAGTYNINLNVTKGTDQNSTDGTPNEKSITITSSPPVDLSNVDFTYSPNNPCINDYVDFTSQNVPAGSDYLWTFYDQNNMVEHITSMPYSYQYSYYLSGSYKVCLTVSNGTASNNICHNVQIYNCNLDECICEQSIRSSCHVIRKGESITFNNYGPFISDDIKDEACFLYEEINDDCYKTGRRWIMEYESPYEDYTEIYDWDEMPNESWYHTHTFNHFGIYSIKYEVLSKRRTTDYFCHGNLGLPGTVTYCDAYDEAIVVDCNLSAFYLNLGNMGQGFYNGISGWYRNRFHFWSGSFYLFDNSNNYLNNMNVTIAACNEIYLNDGFEATGNYEFIAEIFDFDCNFEKMDDVAINNDISEEVNTDNEKSDDIQVTPNPFSSFIDIKASSDVISSLKLTDVMGRTFYQKEFTDPVNYWKIIKDNLPFGIYFLEIKRYLKNETFKLVKYL